MENIIKPNYKRFNSDADKPYFAAYFNTAKQNLFLILRDISESLGIGFDLSNDDNMMNAGLWRYLKTNSEPEVSQQIIKKLEKQFPFADFLAKNYAYKERQEREAIPNDYFEIFAKLINQLYSYRNYYSHYIHDAVEMDYQIIKGMQILFDAARREVKKRFSLKTEDVNHLVRLGKGGKEPEHFFYKFEINKKVTEKALAFFICLWLQRKNAQEFLKKLEGFKKSENNAQKATLETFTYYGLRIPQPKLNSNNTRESLLLDMVNEMKKCPKELYKLLSEDDKAKFICTDETDKSEDDEYEILPIMKRSINRFYYFALKYMENEFDKIKFHIDLGNYCFKSYDQNIEDNIRKRRWIKKMTAFGSLEDFSDEKRPTEWIEKYRKTDDNEENTNNDIYVSRTTPHYHINEQNIGFKIIYDYPIRKKSNKLWPLLTDYDFESKKGKPQNEIADCWLSLYELPAIVFYHLIQQKYGIGKTAENIIINYTKDVISFFEEIEKGIINAGLNDTELTDILAARNLEKSFIPKKIISYLTLKKQNTFNEIAKKRLEELRDENNTMLEKIISQSHSFDKKPGSKDYIKLKSGDMADFIARDMIRFQKALDKEKGKANGTEFQILQAKLAYFGINKDNLYQTFKYCNLIDSKNPHPFLKWIDAKQCNGILDFYIKYLEQRKKFIQKCIDEKKYADYHFLKISERKTRYDKNYIAKLISDLKNEIAINIPRGLFLKPIKELLKSAEECRDLSLHIEQLERVNTAYIIDKYFTIILDDEAQEFYSYKKSYELLNKLFDNRKKYEMRNSLPSNYYSTEELSKLCAKINNNTYDNELLRRLDQYIDEKAEKNNSGPSNKKITEKDKIKLKASYFEKYKDFTENEKQIRQARVCDMVLFMLTDRLFRSSFLQNQVAKTSKIQTTDVEIGKGYKLSEIKADADKGFLSLQTGVNIRMPYRYELNKLAVFRQSCEKSHLSDIQHKIIIKENIQIKNYGDFRSLLKDRKIESLLPYINDEVIHFEALQKELELYEKARMDIFELIYRFEKKFISENNIAKEKKGYVKHDSILKELMGETDEKCLFIKHLRNSIAHNNYPAFILFKDKIEGKGFNELKDYSKNNHSVIEKSVILQFKQIISSYYEYFMDNNAV